MVRTGAQSYVKYGYEGTYAGSATCDKKFGLRDALSSWSLTHNRIDLPALNQLTYESYAYGQQAGEISLDFALSNPWILGAFFGAPSTTGSSNPYTHTYPHASNGINKQPRSFQTEVGFNAGDSSLYKTFKLAIRKINRILTGNRKLVSPNSKERTYPELNEYLLSNQYLLNEIEKVFKNDELKETLKMLNWKKIKLIYKEWLKGKKFDPIFWFSLITLSKFLEETKK